MGRGSGRGLQGAMAARQNDRYNLTTHVLQVKFSYMVEIFIVFFSIVFVFVYVYLTLEQKYVSTMIQNYNVETI